LPDEDSGEVYAQKSSPFPKLLPSGKLETQGVLEKPPLFKFFFLFRNEVAQQFKMRIKFMKKPTLVVRTKPAASHE